MTIRFKHQSAICPEPALSGGGFRNGQGEYSLPCSTQKHEVFQKLDFFSLRLTPSEYERKENHVYP
jgi:hypothetical protein